jgi:RDD family
MARRIGAHLLDSGLALLVIYLSVRLMPLGQAYGFGGLYLPLCQSFIIGWVILKDAWWPGQSLGKRVARIVITMSSTGKPASRLRCVGRQTIFALLVAAIYVPSYLFQFRSADVISQALYSSLLSAVAPIRLLPFLLTDQAASNPLLVAHILVLGLILLEALMVYGRKDHRRIVDLLAGVRVVDAKLVKAD